MPSTPGGGPPRQQSLDTILRDLQKRMTALESVTGGQTVGTPSSNLGGDLGGTLAAANVVGIQSRPVGAQAPSSGQGLVWNGSDWIPESVVNSFEGHTGDVTLADVGALPIGNACLVYLANNATITAGGAGGVYAKIPLDTVDAGQDPLGQWNGTSARFVAAETGTYYCYCFSRLATVPPGFDFPLTFFKNSTNIGTGDGYFGPWGDGAGGHVGNPFGAIHIPLTAGDYLELVGWNDSTANFTILGGSDSTYMAIHRIA